MIKQFISYIGLHVYQEYTHSHPVSDHLVLQVNVTGEHIHMQAF